MRINKAVTFCMVLSISVLAYIIYWQVIVTDFHLRLYLIVPWVLMAMLALIFTDEFIVEVKACKHGPCGTPNKPTIAPMPRYKVPVPPKQRRK